MALPLSVQLELDKLCSEGDRLLDEGKFEAAHVVYLAAEQLIPEPKEDWQASTWVYTAIGDTLFYKGDYPQALKAFKKAVVSPDGLGNPYIHLRLGHCHFETGDIDKAADELTRAYMGAGAEIFEGDDHKYFEFLSTRIRMDEVK